MYKSNFYGKQEKKNCLSGKACNLLSPTLNPKTRQKQFYNGNIPKIQPINLYSAYLSPPQNDKFLSVKNIISPDDKLNQDLLNKFSNYQENLKGKLFQSPNSTNSDLLTIGSLTTQQSNESILSNNTNTSTYIPTNFQPYMNNYVVCQFPNHRYNYSMTNYPQMNCFYGNGNNPFLNGKCSNMNMRNNNRQSAIMVNKQKKNNQNMNYNKTNNNKYKKKSNLNYNKNKISNNNDDKIDVSNFNSNNSIKSGSGSEKSNSDSNKFSSNNNNNSNKSESNKSDSSKIDKINSNNCTNQRKKYYNKFNSPKENNITNENTVILTLKIKVAPNDFRTFNLKKYDDLFISLEKFFDLNKIKQDLVKPIVTKIFAALNKIFWLLNNKIGIYDQEYLNSLYKLWVKNNGQIPKTTSKEKDKEKVKDEDEKSNNSKEGDKKNKSDKSTISSSDSSDGDKKHKKIMSNSFQNMDNISEEAKDNSINSI